MTGSGPQPPGSQPGGASSKPSNRNAGATMHPTSVQPPSGRALCHAPAGTTTFVAGATMTKASGTATSIAVPANAGTYKLHVVDAQGNKVGESDALLRVN